MLVRWNIILPKGHSCLRETKDFFVLWKKSEFKIKYKCVVLNGCLYKPFNWTLLQNVLKKLEYNVNNFSEVLHYNSIILNEIFCNTFHLLILNTFLQRNYTNLDRQKLLLYFSLCLWFTCHLNKIHQLSLLPYFSCSYRIYRTFQRF